MYDNLLGVPTDLWIGGRWWKSSEGARFDVFDPATENVVASVASASVQDAASAVDAAQDAFGAWAARRPRERAEILRKYLKSTKYIKNSTSPQELQKFNATIDV